MTLAVLVGLCGPANDRFYIEDFTINPGKTRTVSILLNNETAYTAFQCDLYIPDGLSVEQDDGDYIFDLTNRKGRDHIIASQTQAEGAIRVISYSPSIKAYNGNSGPLVTFNMTASSNFKGALIQLKNILFTTVSGIEVPFADDICVVISSTHTLSGDVNGDGEVDITDVNAVIEIILMGEPDLAADVNGDGEINIADLNTVIHFILSKDD